MKKLYAELCEHLNGYTGRKMYGYLPKNIKDIVDGIEIAITIGS